MEVACGTLCGIIVPQGVKEGEVSPLELAVVVESSTSVTKGKPTNWRHDNKTNIGDYDEREVTAGWQACLNGEKLFPSLDSDCR